ncbi:MAG: hypothetical protein ABIS29_10430 [Vicinamibacterales bacterium]
MFVDVFAEALLTGADPRLFDAVVRGRAVRFGAALRRFGAALRDAFAALRAARAFGRAVFLVDDLRAGRDAFRVAFLMVLRRAVRVPAFALRFDITNVLSASPAHCKEDQGHP